MSSANDDLQGIKRMLLGIQGTIAGLAFATAGGAGNTGSAKILLFIGIIVFLISLVITSIAYVNS